MARLSLVELMLIGCDLDTARKARAGFEPLIQTLAGQAKALSVGPLLYDWPAGSSPCAASTALSTLSRPQRSIAVVES